MTCRKRMGPPPKIKTSAEALATVSKQASGVKSPAPIHSYSAAFPFHGIASERKVIRRAEISDGGSKSRICTPTERANDVPNQHAIVFQVPSIRMQHRLTRPPPYTQIRP